MNINFDLYKIFYYVFEFKSITKTANYMHISQPAVTRHIKNLESIVGNDLIAKVPKGIELTDEGKKLSDGRLDIIFFSITDDKSFRNNFVVKNFKTLQDIFVINKNLKNESPKKIKLIELNNYPIICKEGTSNSRKYIENYFKENGKNFKPKYNVSKHSLIEKYIDKNLGIGIVTKEYVKEKLKTKELIEIKTDIKLPKRKIVYVIRKNSIYNETIKKFIDKVKSYNQL